jgi:hypothetical protein
VKPQRKIGNDDGAGLGTAEGDLVIGLGVGAGRMETDDGESFGRAAPEVLAAELDRAAHDRKVDGRAREQVVKVVRASNEFQSRVGESRKRRRELSVVLLKQPVRPVLLLISTSENNAIHREIIAPLAFGPS